MKRTLAAVAFTWACLVAAQDQPVATPHPRSVRVPLDILTTSGGLRGLWSVSAAWLDANFESTWAMVNIRNIFNSSFVSARFYAEYYDTHGRPCFTAVFSQDFYRGDSLGPFRPGDSRILMAATSLAPAVRPTRVSFWFLGEPDAPDPLSEDIQAPATIQNGVSMREPDLENGSAVPLRPFSFGEATVSAAGLPVSFTVLASADDSAAAWSRELMSKLRFAPGTRGGEPVGDVKTLILIRVIDLSLQRDLPAEMAWEDPSVQAYVARMGDQSAVPVVQRVQLRMYERWEPFSYYDLGTEWCLQSVRWVWDSSRGRFHRAWEPAARGQMK